MREETERELVRLIGEALHEEAESIPVPPPGVAWQRVRPHLNPAPGLRSFRSRLLPAFALAGALALLSAGVVLAGPAALKYLAPHGTHTLARNTSPSQGRGTPAVPPAAVPKGVASPQNAPGSATRVTAADMPDGTSPLADRPLAAASEETAASPEASPSAEGDSVAVAGRSAAPSHVGASREAAGKAARETCSPTEGAGEKIDEARPALRHQYDSPEQVKMLVPFSLPQPTYLPAKLRFHAALLEQPDRRHAVATLLYREAGGTYLELRVSNMAPAKKQSELDAGEAAGTVPPQGAAAALRERKDPVLLRWQENGLYIEMKTNLPSAEAMRVAQSLTWGL